MKSKISPIIQPRSEGAACKGQERGASNAGEA